MRYSNQNKSILPTLKYDTEMVAEWFKSSPCFRPLKKVAMGNRPLFSPLSYMTANFCERRVLITDALCQQPAASVLSPTRAKIVCLYMPDLDGVDGMREGERPNLRDSDKPHPHSRPHNKGTPRITETPI